MPNPASPFAGFPREGFRFLAALEQNNNRAWFEAHRAVHESALVAPALAFVQELGASLRDTGARVTPEPRLGGSLFRLQRDVRFSRDKTPYKTHVGIRLRDPALGSSAACVGPVYYVELDSRRFLLGVGTKVFDPATLRAYRRAIGKPDVSARLGRIRQRALDSGCEIVGELTKRVPPGVSKDLADDDLARGKGFFVRRQIAVPRQVHGKELVGFCARWFASYHELYALLHGLARR
jgi:uncharacterized protein (TIGR02453 family)